MASKLTLTDCDSVPDKDKLKPRMAASLIQKITDAEVDLPVVVPELSLMIRSITCNTNIKDRLELLRRIKEPVTNVLKAVHGKKLVSPSRLQIVMLNCSGLLMACCAT